MRATDVGGAIALVEGAVAQRVLIGVEGVEPRDENVFGERITIERGADVPDLVRRCAQAAANGERVALVARASDLAAARADLSRISALRLRVVVHCIADSTADDDPLTESGASPALSLADLPWGMLVAAGVAEAVDLALVARRAAEDSRCPFFVLHDRTRAHHVEPLAPPSHTLCEAFLGAAPVAPPPVASDNDERAVADRVPFALGSALRELESLTARRHDVIERVPGGEATLALVGMGALGESMLAETERLRARGQDIAAVRVVAWRPFPGPKVVKALGRALAVSVLDAVSRPLAGCGPLAIEVKAAFSDALTWAPGYPGIGRIPRIASGVVARGHEIQAVDVEAVVENMLADERGVRTFVLGGAHAARLAPASSAARAPSVGFAMRGTMSTREAALATADLCATVLASALGARTRVTMRAQSVEEGGGFAVDILAARDRPRGTHAPHTLSVVAIEDVDAVARGNPLARLALGGLVAFPTTQRSADGVWAEVPPWAKAVVFDRTARLLGWAPATASRSAWLTASAFAAIALVAAAGDRELAGGRRVDGAVAASEVSDALRRAGREAAAEAEAGGRLARDTFDACIEVPRTTLDREDDGVRQGRRDARASA
jgi:pyruvate/2-oxoacid:ferredoxin oxidoreductase alpha subunit